MTGKARVRKTFGTKIKDQAITNNQLFTLSASGQVIQSTSGIVGSGSVNNSMVATDPAGGTGTAKLQTMGDTMVGPIAFFSASATISGSGDDPPYAIDIGQEDGAYSSFVRVTGTGELRWIENTAFTGQLLFLQAVDGFTIYHQTGNIYIPGGENYDVAQDEIVMLLFDVEMTGQEYVLVAAGVGGSGATTELDNLGTTSINADLLPQSSKDLGSSGSRWAETHTTDFYLYSSEHSGAGASLDNYCRIYVNGSEKWIQLYDI